MSSIGIFTNHPETNQEIWACGRRREGDVSPTVRGTAAINFLKLA
jgi:hypothetical protein